MKKFLLLAVLTALTLILVFKGGFDVTSNKVYVSNNILDMSHPINVNIDLDLLKRLDPAYE